MLIYCMYALQLHFSDAAVVINNDDVNILIDLNGYTYGNKNEIFALRPCPIQISLLGYSGTTGADYFDYLVTDHIISPLETRAAYYEKLIYLPHCYIVNNHKHSHRYILDDNVDKSTFPTRAQYGISDDKFVFCNFGQSYKINPEIFSVWMNILKAVPNSVLWLVRSPGECGPNLLKEARQRGVRADQIVLSDGATIEEHIKRGILADLCLDTSCSNSQSTACDILWAGTPLLTLQGQTSAARSAASMLHAVGLSELICTHLIGKYTYSQYPCCMHLLDKMPMGCLEYEEAAVALAQDANRLFTMRRHLEASRDSCALFDTRRWVRNLERGLHQAWRAVEQKQPFIDISPEDQDPVFTLQDVASFM
jgi:protein O-GlcNAc transferase